MLRGVYERLIAAAGSRWAEPLLALISFAESSFFPIPCEVLFLPMCLSRPDRALRTALIAATASVLGSIFGWFIGMYLFDLIALPLLQFYDGVAAFEALKAQTGAGTILLLLFTSGIAHLPPMKVVTILSGAIGFSLPLLVLAAVLTRFGKFLLLGWALQRYGAALADVIHRRLAMVGVAVLLVAAALWLAKTYL